MNYTYALISYDKAANVSDTSLLLSIEQRINYNKETITGLVSRVSRTNQQVKLEWETHEQGISYFKIYRESDARALSYYTSVEASEREFYDEQLTPDTQYQYGVMAVFANGTQSKLSKLIKVKY